MERRGVYLYGFVPRGTPFAADSPESESGERPRAVDLGSVAAVIADVDLDAFEAAMSAGPGGGPDPGWVVPRALRHERVLSAVMDGGPVLPVRFGSLFSTIDALVAMADRHADAIGPFLDRLGDRREWSLRGYVDLDAATESLLANDPEFKARREGLPEAQGARYFREKKLREEAKVAVHRRALHAADAVVEALRGAADEVRSLPLRASEGPRREMILHEAVLLRRGFEAGAVAAVQMAADREIPGLITLEPTGPWPPFHFGPSLDGAGS